MSQANEHVGDEPVNETVGTKPTYLKRIARRLALLPIIVIGGLYMISFTASQPENLGVVNGQLAKCPPSPNCVSTQSEDEMHSMEPITFVGSPTDFLEKIKTVVESEFSRAKLITESDGYLHFEFKSLVFRFVDDVEFLVDDELSVVHFRSAARVGHSDMGVNRKRMNKISESLKP